MVRHDRSRSFKVVETVTSRQPMCDFVTFVVAVCAETIVKDLIYIFPVTTKNDFGIFSSSTSTFDTGTYGNI